jgi:hypothetical protein
MANRRINVSISESLHEKMKGISIENGITISALVTFAVMNFLDQRDAFALADLYKKVEKDRIINSKQIG